MTLELREKGGIRNGKDALDTEGEGRSYVTVSKACADHSILPYENLLWEYLPRRREVEEAALYQTNDDRWSPINHVRWLYGMCFR